MSTKNNQTAHQLSIDFGKASDDDARNALRKKDMHRANSILFYINKVHTCIDNIYEHLVDREYQDFKDELEAAIEYLEYLKEHGDKKF